MPIVEVGLVCVDGYALRPGTGNRVLTNNLKDEGPAQRFVRSEISNLRNLRSQSAACKLFRLIDWRQKTLG